MIKDLLDKQIEDRQIEFKYFVTIPYRFKQLNLEEVQRDNKEVRRSLRSFYNYPLKIWFFCEVHKDPDSRHYGGFHRHLLVEDIPSERWRNPSKRMERFLQEHAPEALFTALSGGIPTDNQKISLLMRVIRLSPSVPNGLLGLRVDPIHDLNGVLGYCLKQAGKDLSIADVVDVAASDMDLTSTDWNGALKRQEAIPC